MCIRDSLTTESGGDEMANEDKKDFNAMLKRDNGMPKIQVVTDPKTIEKYGGEKMYFAPPTDYDKIMKTIPFGRVVTCLLYTSLLSSLRTSSAYNGNRSCIISQVIFISVSFLIQALAYLQFCSVIGHSGPALCLFK